MYTFETDKDHILISLISSGSFLHNFSRDLKKKKKDGFLFL